MKVESKDVNISTGGVYLPELSEHDRVILHTPQWEEDGKVVFGVLPSGLMEGVPYVLQYADDHTRKADTKTFQLVQHETPVDITSTGSGEIVVEKLD